MTLVKISIDTSNFDKNNPIYTRQVQALPERFVEGASDIFYEQLGIRMPVKTGYMKNSRTREVNGLTAIIRILAPYWHYVNDGTGPSPGRYVAAIGKRIRTGTHPGIKGRHFMEESLSVSIPLIRQFGDALLQEMFG